MTTQIQLKAALEQLKISEAVPAEAIKLLVANKEASAPLLLEILKNKVLFYKRIDDSARDAIGALYILSEFREQQAFPSIMKLAALPANYITGILEDETIMSGLPKWIVSTFNGDVQAIQRLIENETAHSLCRDAALNSLTGLIMLNMLSKEIITNYLRELLTSDLTNDGEFSAYLVLTACDINPKLLYPEIELLFQKNLVNEELLDLELVNALIEIKDETSASLGSPETVLVTDALASMEEEFGTQEEWEEFANEECCDKPTHDDHLLPL